MKDWTADYLGCQADQMLQGLDGQPPGLPGYLSRHRTPSVY